MREIEIFLDSASPLGISKKTVTALRAKGMSPAKIFNFVADVLDKGDGGAEDPHCLIRPLRDMAKLSEKMSELGIPEETIFETIGIDGFAQQS